MPGTRQGPEKRKAWEHPQDLVRLIEAEMAYSTETLAVAWLHDILEDGRKEDGSPVTTDDLLGAGFPKAVVEDIKALSHREGEPKATYLERLKEASPRARIVKCVDRICNLREGKTAFKDRRWARYVGETFYFIFPLAEGLREGKWLQAELAKAAQARPVVPSAR